MTKPLQGDPEPQVSATRDEKMSAWKALTERDKKALIAFAAQLAQMYQYADQGMTWEDLMQEAHARALKESRKWEMKTISFNVFMFGILRSIAGDLERTKAGRVRSRCVNDEEVLEAVPDDLNPEVILLRREREAAMQAHLTALQVEFQDDESTFYVLECLMEGLKPREIRERLEMSDKEFDAARQKITRRSLKLRRSN